MHRVSELDEKNLVAGVKSQSQSQQSNLSTPSAQPPWQPCGPIDPFDPPPFSRAFGSEASRAATLAEPSERGKLATGEWGLEVKGFVYLKIKEHLGAALVPSPRCSEI